MIKYKKWKEIPWKKIQLFVYDLQFKIYCHAKDCKFGLVRHYQHKLVKSVEARLLSIRTVSQNNSRIKTLRNLFEKQKYRCGKCNLYLLPIQIVELHHTLDGEKKRTGEIKFVHGHCHDQIHSAK
jgi:hypothetical protein